MKEYLKSKNVHVLYRCKPCKRTVRMTYLLESKQVDNEHPVHYLRKVFSYRRVAGGNWRESHYFYFPFVECPACKQKLSGKAVEGYLKADHPCDRRCTGASGHNCECSCGGENHGRDHQAESMASNHVTA